MSTATTGWLAPSVTGPITAQVEVPGSKSMTNRALLLAAIAAGPARIDRPLVARDTQLMIAALRVLGVEVEDTGQGVTVRPGAMQGPATVDCGLAGTVMRFVPPVAALATGPVDFDGDPRARERPMAPILTALADLGVGLTLGAHALPFTLHGTGSVRGGPVTLDAAMSSQFVSALLLAGARYDEGIDVRHVGKPIPSSPHVQMTVAMLRERGVVVHDAEPDRWVVDPGVPAALDVTIEPDLSNAAPFLAAAVVTGGSVTVAAWPRRTTQAGDRLREIFAAFGAEVSLHAGGLTVSGGGSVAGVDLDLHDVGELTPVVAAVAALADTPSRLRGIAHLRGHETDRLSALTNQINRLGGDVRDVGDGLEIRPAALAGGAFSTYDDHRMAHAAAVVGLRVEGIRVDHVTSTAKTHPDFVGAWTALLA